MDPITQQQILGAASGAAEEVTIDDVFSTTLYEGTGSASTITNGIDLAGEGGLVWIKERDSTESHNLFDTERGATKYLKSDTQDQEYTANSSLSAFNSDGFSHGGGGGSTNQSGKEYAAWTFRKAPGFFDVVTWTGNGVNGRQISHSLGSQPGMIFVKKTNSSANWFVYHRSLGATKILRLNLTNAEDTSTTYWNDTEPTSTEFTVGTASNTNGNGDSFVAYIFGHDDLIQCGSYTGNGSTNSINVGFQAQFVIVKRTDTSGQWVMHDAARSAPKELDANNDTAETDSSGFSFSSTGFKLTDGSTDFNASGGEYAYIAIKAPNPIDYSVGTYYPMFAVKAFDVGGSSIPTANSDIPMRRALSFDTNNTSPLYGNESVSDMINILDDHKYTCNPDFGASGNKISAIMIRHYQSNGTLYAGGQGSFEFDSTNFNIYDNACNATALPSEAPDGTGSMNNVTRACGTISNIALSGLPSGFSGSLYAYLNQSSQRTGEAQATGVGWAADNGDYAFIAICTEEHMTDTDQLDKYLSGDNSTNPGLAFGISDSDGRGTGSETTPREGISRRVASYSSVVTNCLVEGSGLESTHSGHTIEGYFIVYGKYLSA
jgi:hypothetical protein